MNANTIAAFEGGEEFSRCGQCFGWKKQRFCIFDFGLNERNHIMPVVVNGSTYAGAENAQDAAHTR